jgi:hypothetical protein
MAKKAPRKKVVTFKTYKKSGLSGLWHHTPRAIFVGVVAVIGLVTTTFLYAQSAPTTISGNGWTCSRTDPEYMIHAGGADLSVQPDSIKFAVQSAPSGQWSDPYITTGYNGSINSELCNSRKLSNGTYGKSYALPVQLGKQGEIYTSVHDITSSNFIGDTGFDIWFEPSMSDNTYSLMTSQGNASTEIMIWLSHPNLGAQSSNLQYYPVTIDGRQWQVTTQLANDGHGKTASNPNGWNRVNFIAPDVTEGDVTINNLWLNPFFTYAINRGWLQTHNYLMAIDQGGEFTRGTMQVTGYILNGVL